MRSFLSIFFICFSLGIQAQQPDFIGTMLPDNNYLTYNLNDLGAFRQVVLQATSSAGPDTRIWEFATGNYFHNWRPYTFPTTTSFNQVINPATVASSARYNSGFGGASAFLPAITNGNYYTINITEFPAPADQFMAILETPFNPTAINSVATNPVANPNENVPVTITVTMANAPAVGEQVFVRYTTDGFATSNLLPLSFTGATGTAQIPGLPETTTVQFYIYSSNIPMVTILSEVAANGEVAHDMLTLNFNNNGGPNYSYVVQGPLPVELSSFWAAVKTDHIELNWETASELNNSHFEIQKSKDAKTWSSIGQIAGNGNVLIAKKYSFKDRTPFADYNYYRLNQVDYDGTSSYSPTVSAFWEDKIKIELFPNPAKDQLFLKNMDASIEDINIQIYDAAGRKILQKNWIGHSLDISNLEKGMYFIQLIYNQQTYQKRILVH